MKNSIKLVFASTAITALTAVAIPLFMTEKALAFFPVCSQPNLENVGGNGAGPATVDQSLRLAQIRLTHPQASFCSMISGYEVNLYIQWPNPS